jgi:hypothetical protein
MTRSITVPQAVTQITTFRKPLQPMPLFFVKLLILGLLSAACIPSTGVSIANVSTDPTTDACRVSGEACGTFNPAVGSDDLASARAALEAFFDALNGGQYTKAAELYGGSYEELIGLNPDTDPNDHAALLERACTINGYQCLRVKNIVQQAQDWPDTYTFTVEFANPDGSLFVLGPCCGATETDMPPQSRFDFTVMKVPQAGGMFRVQRLPVYMP